MTLRAIIADDELPARERIRHLLRSHPDITVLTECANGLEAVEAVTTHRPDLLFLDVQMPGLDGFGVLAALPKDHWPAIIFTTAYDQHAVRAFDAHALDYLLKPFKPARFNEALQRARNHLTKSNHTTNPDTQRLIDLLERRPAQYLTRLTVKSGEKVLLIKANEIACIESAGNYVVVHTATAEHVLRETLTDLESQLDPARFLRVSRSAIVNLNHIRELQPLFKGDHAIILANGKSLPMTRGLREVEKALRFS